MRNAPAYEVRNLTQGLSDPRGRRRTTAISFIGRRAARRSACSAPTAPGKSTLVRQLVGLAAGRPRARSGCSANRSEPARPTRRLGRTVAYLPQGALALGELKVAEAIAWTGMLRGCGKEPRERETEELLGVLELHDAARSSDAQTLRRPDADSSRLGMTLVGRLPVLILDEPTADIDPALRPRIWELISERAGAGCVRDPRDARRCRGRARRSTGSRSWIAAESSRPERRPSCKSKLAHRTRLEVVVAEDASVRPPRSLAADRIAGEGSYAAVTSARGCRPRKRSAVLEKVMAPRGPRASRTFTWSRRRSRTSISRSAAARSRRRP